MAIRKDVERIKAIEMHFIGGHSYKDISKKLKVRPNTVSEWVRDFKSRIEFDEDLKVVKELIKNESSIPFLVRMELDQRLKRISEKTKVIHYKFFKKP